MALSTKALVTMEDTKAILEIQNDNRDAILEMQVEGVSAAFDNYTDRALASATYTALELDGNGLNVYQLPNWPVTTLTSVELDGILLTEGSDFELDYATGRLRLMEASARWTDAAKNIKITYTAGYIIATAVPKDLRMAALTQIAFEFQQFVQKAWGITNRGQAGSNTSYEEGGLLKRVKALLDPYRRRGI